jgi:Synergist-CTERM protein sorting domain-containing protein
MQNAVSVSFSGTTLTSESGTATSTLAGMFSGWKKLQKADLSGLSIGLLTDTSAMFYECPALTEVKFGSNFYTSNVNNMNGMFADCGDLETLDLSGFYTSTVTDMSMMFYNCKKLATIIVGNGWSTSRVTSASEMFKGDTALVGEKGTRYSKSNDDLTYARVDGGTSSPGYLCVTEPKCFGGVFENGEWRDQAYWRMDDNGNVTISGGQFSRKQWFAYIATDEGTPIKKATSITFSGTAFASEDGKKETETSLSSMFNAWQTLQMVDVSGLDTMSKGTLTSTAAMFSQCTGLTKVKFGGRVNTSKVTDMSMMFYDCSKLKTLFLSKLDTSNVTDMHGMFCACGGLRSLNLSTFDTSKVTDMHDMFRKCFNLRTLDVSKFDTKNVTNMSGMFASCKNLTALDLSSFDTGYVERMKEMFYISTNLRTIRVGFGRWTTANVLMDSGEDMFTGDVALVGGMGTKYDGDHTDKEYAGIDDPGAMLPGYLSGPGTEDRIDGGVLPQPVDLTEEKVSQIRAALASSLPAGVDASTVDVFTVTDGDAVEVSAVLRDAGALSESESEAVSSGGGVPAAILPEMSVKLTGVCCFFGVSLDESVPEGATLVWHPFPLAGESGDDEAESVSLAAGGEKTAVFMKDGEVITTVPEDHEVEVAAYLEAGDYAPVIAAVTAPAKHGGSGGGCDAGFGALALMAVPLVAGRRRGKL